MWDIARHHCKEGWPSDSENIAKHPLIARPGWFSDESKKENHPGCVCFGGFAKFSLMTQPPLLAVVPCHVPHLFAGHGGIEDNWRESRSPLLGQGGVAAPIKKMPRSLLSGRRRGGWFKPPVIGS